MDIMGVTTSESAELATYQLQDIAHMWFKQWKVYKGTDIGPIKWEKFATAFLDRFSLLELRKAKMLEFINPKQGNVSVKEYSLKSTQLATYAPHVVADRSSRIRKFVSGVSNSAVKEYRTSMLINEMDLSRFMVHDQQIEDQKAKEKERDKRARTGSLSFSEPKSEGGNRPQFRPKFLVPAHFQLVR